MHIQKKKKKKIVDILKNNTNLMSIVFPSQIINRINIYHLHFGTKLITFRFYACYTKLHSKTFVIIM